MIDKRLTQGVDLFNAQEYFDSHEVLEDLWREQSGPEQQVTQGIIQIAVGLYHQSRANFVGARKLLKRGLQRLQENESMLPIDFESFQKQVTIALSNAESDRQIDVPPILCWIGPTDTD